MFGNKSKRRPTPGSWDESQDESRESEQDDESWDETRAEMAKAEPYTIFGFKLFESEATLQVNESIESDNDSTVHEEEERQRGFFQRLWEGPTDNTDGGSGEDEEEESESEDDEPIVPPKRVGVTLQRAPRPFTKPHEDETDRSISATLSKNLFAVLSDEQPIVPVEETKPKRRFWNRKSKSNIESSTRKVVQTEQSQTLVNWPGRVPSHSEPTSDLLKRVVAEQSMFSDRRDDDGDVHNHERYTYEPDEHGREEQELFKCFPSMNLGGSISGGGNSVAASRSASLRRSFLSPRHGNNYGETHQDPSSKKCFPSWPSSMHSFEIPSDLTNSTDGIEATEYTPSTNQRRGKAKEQSSVSPYADYPPRPASRSSSGRLPPRQVPVSSATKKKQLNDLLAKYQHDYRHHDGEHLEYMAPKKPITLPPRSKSKTKSKSSHSRLKQNNRNQGSWDEHSGWFTLGSLDVV